MAAEAAVGEVAASAGVTESLAGSAAGSSAGGGSSGVGSSLLSSSGINLDITGMTLQGNMDKWYTVRSYEKEQKQAQENLDRQFYEDQRRFGLQFALQEFATRKNISMQEAQLLLQQEQLAYNRSMEYPMYAQNIKERRQAYEWAKQDRANRQAFNKAFVRGLAKGLSKGGK